MLAERSVRRLSIRAPDDALARRAGFLIEDALRTASLPGDGAGLLLVRRLRLPPFPAGASPQQVALRLEAQCRAATIVDGDTADDAALAAAPAVRFADALAAHLALTRLILAGSSARAWCWPLVARGYRPALDRGAALRAVALSLAALPEAPVALPRWVEHLVGHGPAPCAVLLLALGRADVACLEQAVGVFTAGRVSAAAGHWPALLEWSARHLGAADGRHRWLLGVARACSVQIAPEAAELRDPGPAGVSGARSGDASTDGRERVENAPGAATATDALPSQAGRAEPIPGPTPAPRQAVTKQPIDAASAKPAEPPATVPPEETASRATATTPADVSVVGPPGIPDEAALAQEIGAPTAAGGLLYLVPLLSRLGLGEAMADEATPRDLPQRIFAALLVRLPVAGDDPAWLLCELPLPLPPDQAADLKARRWLGLCRRQLRLRVGIGLFNLVCRPAAIAITQTHVDLRQPLDAVDLRVRRAGLDIDPGWVPWLRRVLRFHYGRDVS